MPTFAANLSLMFTEWEFLDRFAVAADHGFQAVEFQFAHAHSPEEIAKRLENARQTLVLFNAPPGDFAAGDRGLAALPDRFDEFRATIAQAKIFAEHANAKAVHVMAGVADSANPVARAAYIHALRYAVERLDGLDVLIEPLNPRDSPGYFLSDFGVAAGLIGELQMPELKLQYDIYHRQILHGDVLTSIAALMPIIGHVQIAAAPGRGEPGTGETNDRLILGRLDALGYRGYVGCEYKPVDGTITGLSWLDYWRRPSEEGAFGLKSTWRDRLG
jgi:hydroxypyruvate isomerase